MTTATDAGPPTPPRTRATTLARGAAVVVVLALAMLWLFALTRQPQQPPDLLDDATIAARAQEVCASTMATLDDLPPAFEAESASDRAQVISQANAELRAMLDRLAAIPTTGERDLRMMDEWLDDWARFVADREDYADRLAGDAEARFYVTEKEGRQITHPIDRFAVVNVMPACETPGDVG